MAVKVKDIATSESNIYGEKINNKFYGIDIHFQSDLLFSSKYYVDSMHHICNEMHDHFYHLKKVCRKKS